MNADTYWTLFSAANGVAEEVTITSKREYSCAIIVVHSAFTAPVHCTFLLNGGEGTVRFEVGNTNGIVYTPFSSPYYNSTHVQYPFYMSFNSSTGVLSFTQKWNSSSTRMLVTSMFV